MLKNSVSLLECHCVLNCERSTKIPSGSVLPDEMGSVDLTGPHSYEGGWAVPVEGINKVAGLVA